MGYWNWIIRILNNVTIWEVCQTLQRTIQSFLNTSNKSRKCACRGSVQLPVLTHYLVTNDYGRIVLCLNAINMSSLGGEKWKELHVVRFLHDISVMAHQFFFSIYQMNWFGKRPYFPQFFLPLASECFLTNGFPS